MNAVEPPQAVQKRYCLGFLFCAQPGLATRVALIRKARPQWQAGLLNGVGGHVEDGESPVQAMQREFYEEGGVQVLFAWNLFTTLESPRSHVSVFQAHTDIRLDFKSSDDEQVSWWYVRPLPEDTVPNLQWLVPMMLLPDDLEVPKVFRFH